MDRAEKAITVSAGDSASTDAAPVVIDTNLALDLLVFGDAAAEPLRQALLAGALRWLGTPGMRAELTRVLAYPQVARRLPAGAAGADEVLAVYDVLVQCVPAGHVGGNIPRCADPDDQPFIELAVAHTALLLSKDRAVLALTRRLRAHGVLVSSTWPPPPPVGRGAAAAASMPSGQ